MKRYEKYKGSGVEFLGDVPSHWEVVPAKAACDVRPSNVDKKSIDGEAKVRLCNYTDVYYNDLITCDMDLMEATASDDEICRFTLRQGDVIITKDSETADDIGVGAFVPEDLPGVVCGYHLALIRPHAKLRGDFLKRIFDSSYAQASFETRANGLTRVAIGITDISTLPLALPPVEEQAAIAAFLDRETAIIDALVTEQRRLVELLQEKRQAVISHAVTKGLNRNAKLKPSGIDWLGDVPAHWTVTKLGRFAEITKLTGFEYTNHWKTAEDGQVIALRGYNIKEGKLDLTDVERISTDLSDFLSRSKLSPGDIVFPCTGTVGDAAIVPDDNRYHINQNIAKISFDSSLTPEYAVYFLRSSIAKRQFELLNTSGIQPVILISNLRCLVMVVPTTAEQKDISIYLKGMSNEFDALIAEAEKAIALLQERRSALISAAVTGNIDVRELQAEHEHRSARFIEGDPETHITITPPLSA